MIPFFEECFLKMCFHLIDGRDNIHIADNVNKMVGIEITYPDAWSFPSLYASSNALYAP